MTAPNLGIYWKHRFYWNFARSATLPACFKAQSLPLLFAGSVPDLPNALDHAPNHKANPKIHDDAKIELSCRIMLCDSRKVRHDQEIHDIPCHDRG
jgi:hypothetical protein